MSEARQAIRYVFPGLVASAVFLLLWLFAVPGNGELPRLLRVEGEDSGPLSTLVGALLASGAIGYLASQVYFCIHWLFAPVDHSAAAEKILGHLELDVRACTRDEGGAEAGQPEHEASRSSRSEKLKPAREHWVTLTVWWFMTRGVDPRIEASTRRTTSLMDHAHSAGILAWAVLLATGAWWWLAMVSTDANCGAWLSGFLAVAPLVAMLFYNSRSTRRMFEELVDQMVDRAIHTKSEDLTAYRPWPEEAGASDQGSAPGHEQPAAVTPPGDN